jgi:mono/diheme cytochrome c family protein
MRFVVLGVTVCFGAVQAQQVGGQQRAPFLNMDGAQVYLTFCAGCHGFEGVASYAPAPSFSLGERLHRSDDTLLQSVLKGRNGMPPWQDKLPWYMLRAPIAYLRTMKTRRDAGLPPRTRPIPPIYFKFRPVGSTDPYLWYFTGR